MRDAGLVLADTLRNVPTAGGLSILWTTLWIVGALLIGAVIIDYVKRWRQRPVSFHLSTSEQLAHFRLLYERGELSPEEFERIQARLNARLKREMNLPTSAATAGTAGNNPSNGSLAAQPGGVLSQTSEGRPYPAVGIPKPADPGDDFAGTNGQQPPQPGDPNIP